MIQKMIDAWRRRSARAKLVRDGMIAVPPQPEDDRGVSANHSRVVTCFILVLLWSMSSLLLTLAQKNPQNKDIPVVGQKAPVTINADFDFHFENQAETLRAKNAARDAEPKFFAISAEANAAIRARTDRFFSAVRDYPKESGTPETAFLTALPEDDRKLFLECAKTPSAMRYINEALNKLLETGIYSKDDSILLKKGNKVQIADLQRRFRLPRPAETIPTPEAAAKVLTEALMRFQPQAANSPEHLKAADAVFLQLIGPSGTLRYEPVLTQEAADNAAARINPVISEYRKYQTIVRKGELIHSQHRELLSSYFSQKALRENRVNDFYRLTHNMFWCIVLILLGGFYFYHLHPDILDGNRNLAIIAGSTILALGAEYAGIRIFYYLSGASQTMSSALVIDAVPLGLAAVLLAPIMGLRVALGAGFYTASMAALMLDLPFEYALKGFVISFLCALAVRHATNYRSYFLWALFSVTPLVWGFNSDIFARVSSQEPLWRLAMQTGTLALLNGIATSVIALLIIFCYELLFNISTNMSLMLLCDYNHPLLERMKREAPGTFFHSLTVATLAEDGARAIDANYLRAKAGALFHDIGKMARPQYFTENNQQSANQHTALTPQMSSIIIRDHVKEGLELAKKYKLGTVVRDAIAQHHGNDLVRFFYRQAQEISRRTGEPVEEDAFRYQGPRPANKESAIISLADACEAASRSLEKPTPERLEEVVDKIFEQRFQDGQLKNANITLAELEKIRESFVNTLLSMKHGRIAYREDEEEDHEDPLSLEAIQTASDANPRPGTVE
ncbi:MAG: HDIG domain-containing protein [Lentisphaeria bacterium]|nr:HDIG domain-containing protein [Lentisphaeria bacterium]